MGLDVEKFETFFGDWAREDANCLGDAIDEIRVLTHIVVLPSVKVLVGAGNSFLPAPEAPDWIFPECADKFPVEDGIHDVVSCFVTCINILEFVSGLVGVIVGHLAIYVRFGVRFFLAALGFYVLILRDL